MRGSSRDDSLHATSVTVPQAQGLNMVINVGHINLLLRDALRRPLLEVELGDVKTGLRRLSGNVLQVSTSHGTIHGRMVYT